MTYWRTLFAGAGATAALTGAVLLQLACQSLWAGTWLSLILLGVAALPCMVVAFVCLHIISLQPSESHTWSSLCIQYLLLEILPVLGYFYERKMRKTKWKAISQAQNEVLLDILNHSKDTAYGKDHNFQAIKTKQQFKQQQPLVGYEHFRPYVDRMFNGEDNILFPEPVIHFATTSGTTGKAKLFPISKAIKNLRLGFLYFRQWTTTVTPSLKRILGLRYKPIVKKSPKDVLVCVLSYHTAPHVVYFVSPRCVSLIQDETSALYIHALFGLAENDIVQIDGLISPLALTFFKIVEKHWVDLCNDIEKGTVSVKIKLDTETRRDIDNKLQANPNRAEQLRSIFSQGFDNQILKKIWPSCNSIYMLASGGFSNSTKLLLESYADRVNVHSYGHGASEGMVGLAYPRPNNQFLYTFFPEFVFYEFIPEERCDDENPPTVYLEEVEVGRSYEVVLTTKIGLYRYRLGDVITIAGYMEGTHCPVYQFSYRRGQMLNAMVEKTPENLFYQAVSSVVDGWPGITLVDYTATENINATFLPECDQYSKHYILFVELRKETSEPSLTSKQLQQFDMSLCQKHEFYETLRAQDSLGPMKVIQMKLGSFQKLRKEMTKDTNNIQFKMPRVMRGEQQLRFLQSMRI